MPIHDWTLVDAGLFHAFRHGWITALAAALNAGALPADYYALPEQSIRGPVPDILTLQLPPGGDRRASRAAAGFAVATAPPQTRVVRRAEAQVYARKADHVVVRHRHGQIVAVIEIVSPGNKASAHALRTFVEKAASYLSDEVHLLVVDLFPPTRRDPQGIHKAIWDEFIEEAFELPADGPLIVASYDAGPPPVAYVESVGVGDTLPPLPIFLKPGFYVPAPLEESYQRTWNDFFPAPLKGLLEEQGPAQREG